MQALAVHDCVRSVGMGLITQPCVRHDSGCIAQRDLEQVEGIVGQRFVPVFAGEYPLPARRVGEAVLQLSRRLAEQNVPWFGPRVNQCQAVGIDLGPTQVTYLAWPAPGQHIAGPDILGRFENSGRGRHVTRHVASRYRSNPVII